MNIAKYISGYLKRILIFTILGLHDYQKHPKFMKITSAGKQEWTRHEEILCQ